MQGFILRITRSIKEDVIVNILTSRKYYTLYRFYGARHSILYTGRKIDFEIEYQGVYIPKLRNIMHLAREYEIQLDKVYIWQQFCALLDKHLQDTNELESFYYEAMNRYSQMLHKQDPRRLVCALYVALLEFEGRLYKEEFCFICGEKLGIHVAVARGFLLACPHCVAMPVILHKKKVFDFFHNKSLMNMSDSESFGLYDIILQGL